jgi:hypothetical protein
MAVTPKTFMLIAGNSAAEQRAIVAHSASYGFNRMPNLKAPAGATENHGSKFPFLPPHPGLEFVLETIFPRLAPWATIVRHSVAGFATE